MLIWAYVGVAAACAALAGASTWGVRKCLVRRRRKKKKREEESPVAVAVVDSKTLEDLLGWDAITYEDPRENVPEPYHSTEEHYQTMVHFSRAMEMVHFPNTSYYDFPRRPLGRTSSDPHLNWKLYDRSFVDLALSSALSPMIGKFFKDPDFEGALEQYKEPPKPATDSPATNSSPTCSSATKRNTLFNANALTELDDIIDNDYLLPVMFTGPATRLMGRDDAQAALTQHPSLELSTDGSPVSSNRLLPFYRSSFIPAYHASIYSALRRKSRILLPTGVAKRRRTSASVIWAAKSHFEEKEADESSAASGLASSVPPLTGQSSDKKSGLINDEAPPATNDGTPATPVNTSSKPATAANRKPKILRVIEPSPVDRRRSTFEQSGFLSHMPSSLTNFWHRSGLSRHPKRRGLGSTSRSREA